MTERLNIHGLPDCQSPSGCKLCNVCCIYFEVSDKETAWHKPAGSPCKFLQSQKGCSIHERPRPRRCESFHCSALLTILGNPSEPPEKRIDVYKHIFNLINLAEKLGQTNSLEAERARNSANQLSYIQ